ncbi:hypothetical protein [Paenibacillus paeoniae]|uniref:Uncharacterized protein n=1 Tax=Paenibacillus paeoniae TaxID=2292705 RepID=A0A371PE50_9BACL|nr:hypothetical protein [Paenibacillus paeoniae]REK74205.1 hypothetical protein DX130_16810 [Paenibacillus paeoniae]
MTIVDETDKLDDVTSQLSAHIWGHRFKDGQRGPEYVLEFLNVLSGTEYSFRSDRYYRRRSIGLREFIFEGVKEGRGAGSTLELNEAKKEKLIQAVQENNVTVLKQFLRNLEIVLYDTDGKEADRSWFARSLYPLHESLLYVELRKKNGNYSIERNFFARGGELYFLMLGHGTEHYQQRRLFIEQRFHQLLTRNKIIEKVVGKISAVFDDSEQTPDRNAGQLRSVGYEGRTPMLPHQAEIDNRALFEQFGVEMENLLLMDMDVHEMFHLLTSLVCFQLARYMHVRSQADMKSATYFFDCMDGTNTHIYRQAAMSLEQHEAMLKERYLIEFERKSNETFGNTDQIEQLLPQWQESPDMFYETMGLRKLRTRKETIKRILLKCRTVSDVQTKLKSSVREVVTSQLDQVQVTRVIARDGGFATYRRGSASNYRYTISDSFLQMLVFTIVQPGDKMEFHEFLNRVHMDYGIVIGEQQAKETGIYEKSGFNVRYFQDNERALRKKLRHNGLLIEFSDATAMIQNPYARCSQEVGLHV